MLDNAVVVNVNLIKLAVGVVELQLNRSSDGCCACPHLCDMILKALTETYLCLMFFPRNRVEDRSARGDNMTSDVIGA